MKLLKPSDCRIALAISILLFSFPIFSQTTIIKSISSSTDDAEEEGIGGNYFGTGAVFTKGTYLELVNDFQEPIGLGNQTLGLRFNELNIPRNVKIIKAYLIFHSEEPDENNSNSDPANLTITGQASDNAATFSESNSATFGISKASLRPKTNATVSWLPEEWIPENNYNSADIAPVVQEIVNRKAWSSNNSMAFFISGSGSRTAQSYDYSGDQPVKLSITYVIEDKNTPKTNDKYDEVNTTAAGFAGSGVVISTQPLSGKICKGGTYSPDVIVKGGKSVLNYQWQFSPDGTSEWTNVTNDLPSKALYTDVTTPAQFTVSGDVPEGNYYYRCLISSASTILVSKVAVLSVEADPSITIQPLSDTICVGGSYAPFITASGGAANLNYQWQYSNTGFSGWANVVNGTPVNATYSNATSKALFNVTGNIAEGSYYYRCVVSSSGNGCNSAISISGVLTILKAAKITTQPVSTSICEGGDYNPIIKTSGGTPSYQWQFSANGTSGWANVVSGIPANAIYANVTSANLFKVLGSISHGSYYYRCIVTSGQCNDLVSNTVTLTVKSSLTVLTQPANVTICKGGTYSPGITVDGVNSGLTYQWQFSSTGFSGWANVSNGTPINATYSNSTSYLFTVSGNIPAGTYYYRCVISSGSNGCSTTSFNGTLTVTEDPSLTEQPLDATINIGGTYTPKVNASGGTSSLNVQWQYSANGSTGWSNVVNGTPANAVYGNATSFSNFFVTGNIAPGTYFYRCVVSSSGSGCNSVNSNVAKLTITKGMIAQRSSDIPKDNIMDLTTSQLVLYPNPANDYISFDNELLNTDPSNIYIYNSIGQLRISINNLIVNELNISDLSNDVYIVKLINKSGIFTGKFIKTQ